MPSRAEEAAFRTARLALGAMAVVLAVSGTLRALGLLGPAARLDLFLLGIDPMAVSGFLAAGVLFLLLPRRGPEWVVFAILACGLEAALWLHRPESWSPLTRTFAFGVGFGLAGLAGLAWRSLAPGEDRRRARLYLALALILTLFSRVTDFGHDAIAAANPLVWDEFGYVVDGAWGFQPAYAAARLLASSKVSVLASFVAYVELPLLIMAACVLNVRNPRRSCNDVLACVALLGVVGPLLYNVVPMVGTAALAGGSFPLGPAPRLPSPPRLVPWSADLPRNCMPSLHLAWILALFWGTRWIGTRVRLAGLAAVLLTLAGALLIGHHYVIDFSVAVPFALVFQALTSRPTPGNRPWRRLALVGGTVVTLGSLAVLRWAPGFLVEHPAVAGIGQVAMVVGALFLEGRLARATLADGGWVPDADGA